MNKQLWTAGFEGERILKVLVIPDVHLKPWMFDRAEEILGVNVAERAVCLMDLADDWGCEDDLDLYDETFDRAVAFQKLFPDTLWCYGNHDLSYVWQRYETGFSEAAIMTVNRRLTELRQTLPHSSQMAYIHRIDNVLFMHGGLTEDFVLRNVPDNARGDIDSTVLRLNCLGRGEMWQEDSPVWFRPQENIEAMHREDEFMQVVGHTPVQRIERDRNVISCDVFSTWPTGEPYGNEEFLLIDTETRDFIGVK